jgi:hypothetical protein
LGFKYTLLELMRFHGKEFHNPKYKIQNSIIAGDI